MDKTAKNTGEKHEIKDESLKKLKNIAELKKEYHMTEEDITVKLVLDKIRERLEYYIKILVQILQPEEFHSLHECTMFADSEKNELFEMYKSMMILHREIVKTEIKNEEEDMLSAIDYAHAEMNGYKKNMLKTISKMQDSWKKTSKKNVIGYFG